MPEIPEGWIEEDELGQAVAIHEVRIATIELASSTVYNKVFKPHEGKVKWFFDELGQCWVKFKTMRHQNLLRFTQTHVWPAACVVEVVYEEREVAR